jgi:ketosteroid isomerase-like protein
MLNSTTALCSTITVRRKADGTKLQRRGTTYLLRKGPDGWRIRQLMVTDFDKLL